MAELALQAVVSWSLGLLMHWWPRLRAPARRWAAIATSVAGLAFLVAAVRAEGLRESAIPSVVLVGPALHTATASASASLYYYVLTGACLLLGFTGLVLGEPLSRWLRPRWLLSSAAVAWLITLVRFLLEKSAAPPLLAQSIGVTWLAPVAGAYLAVCLAPVRPGWRPLLRALVAYAFLVRGFVAATGLAATLRGLGTHYDVSQLTTVPLALTSAIGTFAPGSPRQVVWLTLLPQLVVWPVITVVAGLAGAAVALAIARLRPTRAATATASRTPPAAGGD